MKIGILALQGGFANHAAMLRRLPVEQVEVRHPWQLAGCSGLILPGGEATTLVRQLAFSGLDEAIATFAKDRSIFGTCAGLIVMAERGLLGIGRPLEILDVDVRRNGYGRQVASFTTTLPLQLPHANTPRFPAVFIRAPVIERCGDDVAVLASHHEHPVLVQEGRHLAATFHPELANSKVIHEYFVSLCRF